jgi:hypothetical protein
VNSQEGLQTDSASTASTNIITACDTTLQSI